MNRSPSVYSKATPRQKLSPVEKQKQADRENLESAVLILSATPDQFDEDSLAARWARAFLARTPKAPRNEHGQREMFGGAR
jgi:hypothetical protein